MRVAEKLDWKRLSLTQVSIVLSEGNIRSGGMAPCNIKLGTSWVSVITCKPEPLYPSRFQKVQCVRKVAVHL
jgi:hypothetical protein